MRRSRDHDNYGQNLSYDAAGSLIGVTDTLSSSLFAATYSYGIQAFRTSTTDMDLGYWPTYTYNSLGELVYWLDDNGNGFTQEYDALSRLTSRTEAEGTSCFKWGTSAGNKNIGVLEAKWLGPCSQSSLYDYKEAYTYDSAGRPSTATITEDNVDYSFDYTYTNQGALETLTYPTSTSSTRVKVKYGYAYGLLQSVTDWTSGSAGTVYWTANAQNARGQTTQETLGNSVVTNRSFDGVTGWLNTVQSGVSGGTGLQNQAYAYDKIGNVTQRQENTLGLTEDFYYDNLYRLDYSTLNTGGGAVTNLDLAYDAMGNITSRSDVNGGATWTYHGTKKHAVTSTGSGGTSYSYDDNGNMISRGGSTIAWTSYNYPSSLAEGSESTTFHYGPDRQYYRQDYSGSGPSETTYYIGGLLEKVASGGTSDWRHYIKAEGQIVAIVSRKSTGTNAVNYPLEDHLGSLTEFTNNSGTMLARESYAPYGAPREGADWGGAVPGTDQATISGITRLGFTGHTMLANMSLIHMNGRVQDSLTGRFLSADPNIPNPGFTQSWNRYAYVNNNPLSYIDPSGFLPECREGDSPPDCEIRVIGTPVLCSLWEVPVYYWWGPDCVPKSIFDPETGDYQGPPIGEDGGGPRPHRPVNLPPPPRPDPRPVPAPAPQPQETKQKIKDWVCRAGNSLVGQVDGLASLGMKLQLGGAAVTMAGLIAQPEVNPAAATTVGGGVSMMVAGGAAGLLATTLQIVGGIAQMVGSSDNSVGRANTLTGSATMLFGAGTGWLGSGSYRPGNSVAARNFNSVLDRQAAFSGAGVDTLLGTIPGLSPGQAACGN